MKTSFPNRINALFIGARHPQQKTLNTILCSKTSLSSSGYPYIMEGSFRKFLQEIPHLFQYGEQLLSWISRVEQNLEKAQNLSRQERENLQRTLSVLRQIVQSAAICAPSDLWVTRHVLSAHARLGLPPLYSGDGVDLETMAKQRNLDPRHLSWDLSLLHCRGYLKLQNKRYSRAENPQAGDVLDYVKPISEEFLRDMTEPIAEVLGDKNVSSVSKNLVARFLSHSSRSCRCKAWFASSAQMEIGYRLVPAVLALHILKVAKEISAGKKLLELLPGLPSEMRALLFRAGIIQRDTALTILGERVLQRGPGPFGIIHAYVPYMRELPRMLTGEELRTWVQRGKNIAASQDANRKTFEMANDCLDRFCRDNHFQYRVFIEHALGLGEATRQRLHRTGESDIQYFGADLEDAAIERAIAFRQKGALPGNMIFIRRADIGNPHAVINAVLEKGFATEGAVMFVGNGFHEIRGQTNEKIIQVFRSYCEAGILVAFTEESALSDHDLLTTGWNTYHAGFRYVHELSGQGLRPVFGTDKYGRHSWKICASLGGYAVLNKYCAHTRTIYPYPRKGGYNPPISMTYFCVPAALARDSGFYPLGWSPAKN